MIPGIVAALGQVGAAGGAGGAAGTASAAAGASTSIQSLTSSISGLAQPAAQLGNSLTRILSPINMFTGKILELEAVIVSTAAGLVNALAAPIDTVKQLGDAIGRFTRLSNPGQWRMFEYRVENTFATLGRLLEPILDSLTRSAEKMGDMFAKAGPAIDVAVRAIAEYIDLLTERIVDLSDTGVLENVGIAFRGMIEVIKMIQQPITFVIRQFTALKNSLMDLLGIPRLRDEDARSDIAVRQPQYTNTEAIQRELARQSLMSSLNLPKQETTESLLGLIWGRINEVLTTNNLIAIFAEAIRQAREKVGNEVDKAPVPGVGGLFGMTIEDVRDFDLAKAMRERRAFSQES